LTSSLKLLQITDLHLLADPDDRLLGVDTADTLRAVLAQAFTQARPDAIIASGDITHHGEAAAYARFEAILAEFFDGPVLVLPGNHDESAAMVGYTGQRQRLQFSAWTVIGVDSHENGQPGARLTSTDLDTLRAQCREAAADGKRVLIACHHPMVDTGCPWLDKDRIQNADELLVWLARHSTTAAIVFGHAHQVVEHRYRDIALLGTPATCFQFQPDSATFTIDIDEWCGQPGYRWLQLQDDGSINSTVDRVADYPLEIELPNRT
jgi:Icc protein